MAKKDKWNYWVFRTSLNGQFEGEKSKKFYSLSASVDADRLTPEWKSISPWE